MNELMITYDSEAWLYFKTNATSVVTAIDEFRKTCESAGINIDNMYFADAVLRDRNGNDIDLWFN